jgi:hypothetical protein
MAASRPVRPRVGQFSWPDLAGQKEEKRLETGTDSGSGRERLVRARALAETSAAFTVGGLNISIVCRELADRLAHVLAATCLVRPLRGGPKDFPVALGQGRDQMHRELAHLLEADPRALAAACSARAAGIGRSILLPELAEKCLRLWSEQSAWPCLDSLDIRSMLVAPVSTNNGTVGSILVWRQQGAPALHGEDQLFVEEVARRLACTYL